MMDDKNLYHQYMYNYPHKKAYRKINPIDISSLKPELESSNSGLYIHIPFCRSRCGYCNLFSLCGDNFDLMKTYIKKLEEEASFLSDIFQLRIDEFIIGGGTPLYLDLEDLESLLSIPSKYFNGDLNKIFLGIETSPKDSSPEKINLLKKYQVNRVSMGIQSFLDEELKSLNRNHKVEDIEKALLQLKNAQFDILNLDLIYGIENQTLESFEYSLKKLLEYEPDEIFLYPLYIRENKNIKPSVIPKSEFYNLGRNFLIKNGYKQNSMRRFTLKQNKSSSCGFSNSIALGVGGRSYVGNLHYCNNYSDNQKQIKYIIEDYLNTEDFSKIDYGFILDEGEEKRLFLIKNLFTKIGLQLSEYENRFSASPMLDFPILKTWLLSSYLENDGVNIYPTDLGISLSDSLGPKLMSETVKSRMLNWKDSYEE